MGARGHVGPMSPASPVRPSSPPPARPARFGPGRQLAVALVAGLAIGVARPDGAPGAGFQAGQLGILSTVFLRLVQSLIAPLVFGTLVAGVAGHGSDLRRIGTLAARSLGYFELVTTLALGLGLLAANLVRPGDGVHLVASAGAAGVAQPAASPSLAAVLEHGVPRSIVEAAAGNDVLQIVVFALLFGTALAQVPGPVRAPVLSLCDSLTEVMFRYAAMVMRLTPVAVGAAMAAAVGRSGVTVLVRLAGLVLTLYGALAAFALLVLLPIALGCRVPLRAFGRAVREPWLIAFTTASSEAAFPVALRNLEQLGVPRRIASFVLPAGYTFNMDGTALYLTLAAVFVAQAAGIAMPIPRQALMLATLMLTSKGLAAVPRASLVILSGTVAQFGLPAEGVALILGVDAVMDMGRTSVNVIGNCLAAVVMARWDGSFAPADGGRRETPADGAPLEVVPRAPATLGGDSLELAPPTPVGLDRRAFASPGTGLLVPATAAPPAGLSSDGSGPREAGR
jgi:proton glutamate symport protein